MDWHNWHAAYDEPGSSLNRRLAVVQEQIASALAALPAGPLRVISVCAGQGRDLIGVLAGHPRQTDVSALLVELDPDNAVVARQAGLPQLEVLTADAAVLAHYTDYAPADLLLMCGVFGNIADEDIERTIGYCRQLCREGGIVIWTRHRFSPDLVPWICERFEEHGFAQVWLSAPDVTFGVGVHRFTGEPQPLDLHARMFTFDLERAGGVQQARQ